MEGCMDGRTHTWVYLCVVCIIFPLICFYLSFQSPIAFIHMSYCNNSVLQSSLWGESTFIRFYITQNCLLLTQIKLKVYGELSQHICRCKIVDIPPLWHLSSFIYSSFRQRGLQQCDWWFLEGEQMKKSLITLHDLHDYAKSDRNNSYFLMKHRRNLTQWIKSIQ